MNEHFEQDAKKFKKVEEHVSAAFLGGQNSYSHLAAISFFGSVGIELKSSPSISGLFQLVSNNETDFSVVPSESAASGSIAGVIDHLLLSSSKGIEIMAEKRVVEKNALSAWPGVTEQEIGRVFGHAHHLSGCETYLLLLDRRRQSLGLPATRKSEQDWSVRKNAFIPTTATATATAQPASEHRPDLRKRSWSSNALELVFCHAPHQHPAPRDKASHHRYV